MIPVLGVRRLLAHRAFMRAVGAEAGRMFVDLVRVRRMRGYRLLGMPCRGACLVVARACPGLERLTAAGDDESEHRGDRGGPARDLSSVVAESHRPVGPVAGGVRF
ncbi:MAG: hypothetical protein P8Y10_05750 [Gemmatimonadales bacterium]